MSDLTPRQVDMLYDFEQKEDCEIVKAFELEQDDWFVLTDKGRETICGLPTFTVP